MSKKKSRLVPTLRFPDFENQGEWKEKVISQLGETVNGLSGKKGEDFGSGEPFVQYKQVFDKSYIDFSDCGRVRITKGENQNKLQKGDILFTTSSETPDEVGFASVVVSQPDKHTYLNSFCFILRPYDIEEVLPDFSRYLFHSPTYRKSVTAIAQGSTRFNLSKGAFLGLKLPLPAPPEQQKIADCLSSLDELIATHTKKHEALQSYKKGLMQNLFPAEDETVPSLRFPEFRDKGDWVEQKVSDLLVRASNPVDVDPKQSYREIGIRSHGKGIFHKDSVSGEKLGNKRVFWVEEDAFVVNIVFAWELAVANTTSEERGMIASHRFPMYGPKDGKSNTTYMKYFFLTHKGKELLWIASPGGAGRNKTLGQKEFDNLGLLAPGVKEQKRIADYLSSIDGLISVQAQKIEDLKAHKNGLMQQLFPAMDGVGA